jgi:hypothetical protein
MALRMTRPTTRPDSSFRIFRKRVPEDIQKLARGKGLSLTLPAIGKHEAITVSLKVGTEVKLSLRTRDPDVAKARSGAVEHQLQQEWAALRSGPIRLNKKQTVALAGWQASAARR